MSLIQTGKFELSSDHPVKTSWGVSGRRVQAFGLGDIVVSGSGGAVCSRGHVPDQGMLIHVAVAGLFDGLRRFAAGVRRGGGRGGAWELVGGTRRSAWTSA
ncbi:hypothetical protein ACL02R_01455 [Streptomyces sp. MS19]|uniref:hypothetical protein n=1 Tax=Streptomyces sp. MS19 TaxID=3385972 RepID=UPI00399F9017